ncbi:unnamed protein product, partial [Ectocarpus sp. 13 AM-2016]
LVSLSALLPRVVALTLSQDGFSAVFLCVDREVGHCNLHVREVLYAGTCRTPTLFGRTTVRNLPDHVTARRLEPTLQTPEHCDVPSRVYYGLCLPCSQSKVWRNSFRQPTYA